MTSEPKCKCGKPCAYYGPVGGYSVKCVACNAHNSALSRASRKRIRAAVADDGAGTPK